MRKLYYICVGCVFAAAVSRADSQYNRLSCFVQETAFGKCCCWRVRIGKEWDNIIYIK